MHTGGAERGRDEVTSSSPDSAASILERAQVIAEQLHEEALREAERATAEATRLEAENRALHERATAAAAEAERCAGPGRTRPGGGRRRGTRHRADATEQATLLLRAAETQRDRLVGDARSERGAATGGRRAAPRPAP